MILIYTGIANLFAIEVANAIKIADYAKISDVPLSVQRQHLSSVCGLRDATAIELRVYDLKHTGSMAGFMLGKWRQIGDIRKQSLTSPRSQQTPAERLPQLDDLDSHRNKHAIRGELSTLAFVSYFKCKGGLCADKCVIMHKALCPSNKQSQCVHQMRAIQVIDLMDSTNDIDPGSGSWWGTSVPEPRSPIKHPLLLLQSRVVRGHNDKQYIDTHTILLSLQRPRSPQIAKSVHSLRREPPRPRAGRKHPPVGHIVQQLQFRKQFGQIELKIISIDIPSPFNRCCEPTATHSKYTLKNGLFQRSFSL
jgi:hypothetical protein